MGIELGISELKSCICTSCATTVLLVKGILSEKRFIENLPKIMH